MSTGEKIIPQLNKSTNRQKLPFNVSLNIQHLHGKRIISLYLEKNGMHACIFLH